LDLSKNKIAVVTGASKGLGAAIAITLAMKGVHVYGIGRKKDSLKEVAIQAGNNFEPITLDINDETAIHDWYNNTFTNVNTPDILINNAGIGFFSKVDETPTSNWLEMVNTNLNGVFYVSSTLIPDMKKKKTSCHIINIGSILGKVGRTESTGYCATKFGIQGFSEALFMELRGFNIKVTCINPGSIETDFFKTSGQHSHHNMLQPFDIANTIIHLLETPDNMLINEMTIRPLNPKPPNS
jgi:NADP-dependent 3-hydroxy acid dehydrogenase YdfG